MINIKCFGKRKDNATSTTSNTGYSNTTPTNNVNGVYIWGQYHDHTSDVDGDFVTSGSISAQGSITTPSDINGANLTLSGDIQCDDINSTGDLRTTDIYSANITNTNNIVTDTLQADTITANDGTITNLIAEYLTVTKQAHFFELIIDKIKSNAGQVILSAANAIIDKVTPVTDGYKLYWRRVDEATNKKISNDFQYQDQIRCQTFNVHEGTNFNVANKYYWRLVTDTGAETTDIDGEQVECNYIEVSDLDKDGTSIPEVGDEIVQLGNRTDTTRQNAIILSACTSPDPNVTAPSIVQYTGINSYSLNNRILNQIAANGNTFTGNFMVVNGNTVDNVLNLITGTQPTIQTDSEAAFLMANTSSELTSIDDAQNMPTHIQLFNGTTQINYSSWTTNSYIKNNSQQVPLKPLSTYSDTGLYIAEVLSDNAGGVYVDWNFIQDYGIYTNYSIEIYIEWTDGGSTYHTTKTIPVNVLVQGNSPSGSDAEFDRLQILTGDATVGVNDTLTVGFTAQVQHVKGNVVTNLTNLSGYSMDVVYNNNGGIYTATKDTTNHRFVFTDTITNFSALPTIPTNITFMLIKQEQGAFILVDTAMTPIKFNAGSIFEVKNDAITAAVTSSNGYTDAQIAVVNLTAQGLSSRVAAIEGDYVTSSELNQTATSIELNVYDNLRNKTGIDVQAGQITLNAETTVINGNLNLNNTDNGITIYDNDGTARIQLQPQNIGSIDNFDGGAEYYVRTSISASNQSTYSLTTEKKKIGEFSATDTMTMTNVKCMMKSAEGRYQELPTPSSVPVTIYLYKEGSNTPVTSFSKTFTYSSTTQEFSTSDISYTIPSDGVYLFNATFTYNTAPQYQNVYEEVYANINQTIQHQTYIGADGMYCNPAHDAMLWAGSDAIVMRWGEDGIRVDSEGLKRTPDHLITSGEPEWLPFDNYTHVTKLTASDYSYYNNRYAYTINPLQDTGIIAAECPSFSQSGRATHLMLPAFTFTDNGTQYTLPVGYTVKIINTDAITSSGTLANNKYIYVDDQDLHYSWKVRGEIVQFCHLGGGLWCSSTTISS